MYTLNFSSNPSNWLGPVWILVNYLVWKSLMRYGFEGAAFDRVELTVKGSAIFLSKNA